MDKVTDKKKSRGKSNKEMAAEGSMSSKPSINAALGGLTPEERKARAQEGFDRRLSELKSKLPDRSLKLLEGIPSKFKGSHLKALTKECSPQAAIRAKCHDCAAWEDVLKNVGDCRSYTCPIWAWRPYQEKKG